MIRVSILSTMTRVLRDPTDCDKFLAQQSVNAEYHGAIGLYNQDLGSIQFFM